MNVFRMTAILAATFGFGTSASAETFQVEPQLRACCALGYDLLTKVGTAEVSATIHNVANPAQLGRHTYLASDLPTEINGLIYTCRGGVIDLAHVRDNADRTAYLFHRLITVLGSSSVLPLYEEGGLVELRLGLLPERLNADERRELALVLAQHIAYELSIWHEIVTWFGYESIVGFSERISAFSPEDMFSNAVGSVVGINALRSGGTYNVQVANAINQSLAELLAVPAKQTKEALDSVEGLWWDRQRFLPDFRAVTRRNLDTQNPVQPWLIPGGGPQNCEESRASQSSIEIPELGPHKIVLRELYELRIHIDRGRAPAFPAVVGDRSWISSQDLPILITQMRDEMRLEFGPQADQRDMALDALGLRSTKSEIYDKQNPCGSQDALCSATRSQELHGLRLGKLWIGGGTQAGPLLGGTLAELDGSGGGFSVFSLDAVIDASHRDFSVRLRAVETRDILYFCEVDSGDGSGETIIDFPFINPFSPRCRAGVAWGVRVNLWDSFYDSRSGRSAFRPVDFSLAVNLLRNGRTVAGASRRLVLDFGLAPASIKSPDISLTTLTAHFGTTWTNSFLDDRITLSVFGQMIDDLLTPRDFGAEIGLRLGVHALWSHRDRRNGQALHSLVSFGLEAGAQYWRDPDKALPGRLRVFPWTEANLLPGVPGGAFVAMMYLETTIPKLGLF